MWKEENRTKDMENILEYTLDEMNPKGNVGSQGQVKRRVHVGRWCMGKGPKTEVYELMQNKDNQVRISVWPRGIIIIIKLLAMNK